MIEYVAILGAVVAATLWRYFRRSSLDDIPGPTPLPLLGNALQINKKMPPITLHRWYKEYGPVYKVHFPEGPVVVVADYDSIKEVLVTRGHHFAGRPRGYRDYLSCRSSAMYATQPGERHTALRKLFFSFSKAYGSGMDDIERMANEIADELFANIRNTKGETFDPLPIVESATVKFTLLMMSGDYLEDEDPLVRHTKELNENGPHVLAQSPQGAMLDHFPWLRFFGLKVYKQGMICFNAVEETWKILQERQRLDPNKQTLTRLLHDHVKDVEPIGDINPKLKSLELDDAKSFSVIINFAGGVTTATSLYAIIRAFLHYPEIQDKVYREISQILESNRQVSLQDKSSLPYTCAFLKEAERFFSIAPLGLAHRSVVDTQIMGMPIPKNTRILTSLWSLHHDEVFWGDPKNFRPERFLDDNGDMLQRDHEKVRHVMGFGAGVRGCPGETIANTRMFLWTVDLIRMFKILPPDSQKLGPCDPTDGVAGAPTRIASYKLRSQRSGAVFLDCATGTRP